MAASTRRERLTTPASVEETVMPATTAPGTGPMAQVIVRGPGQGRAIPGAADIILKATSADTGGAIGVLEATAAPNAGPPPHIHYDCDELFYILAGHFRFLVGERTVTAPPGTFVFVPRGTVHAVRNIGTEPGKVLAAYLPGGMEQSFEEYAQAPREERDRIARRYNSEFV